MSRGLVECGGDALPKFGWRLGCHPSTLLQMSWWIATRCHPSASWRLWEHSSTWKAWPAIQKGPPWIWRQCSTHGRFDWYLVIPGIQVDLAEIFLPFELVQKVINPWDRVPILNSDLVQCPIVNAKFPSPILLLHQHDRAPTGWWIRLDVTFLK